MKPHQAKLSRVLRCYKWSDCLPKLFSIPCLSAVLWKKFTTGFCRGGGACKLSRGPQDPANGICSSEEASSLQVTYPTTDLAWLQNSCSLNYAFLSNREAYKCKPSSYVRGSKYILLLDKYQKKINHKDLQLCQWKRYIKDTSSRNCYLLWVIQKVTVFPVSQIVTVCS